ncbi:MAG: right-handed parallel beta-helix repeat-containing protein, partial [Candidatus Lokiarchaeota archaeon]|nr:right-handed parallel beta-helix repeat-containing protein [Candidatus Lokiarchaeota archaeon]
MKYKKQYLTILTILLLTVPLFSLYLATSSLLSVEIVNTDNNTQYLKPSTLYTSTIEIDDTDPTKSWLVAKAVGVCTGSGTSGNPYIIANHIFDLPGGICLDISNSRKFFRIINCTFKAPGMSLGISIINTTNGRLDTNTVRIPFVGLYIDNCSLLRLTNNDFLRCGAPIGIINSDNIDLDSNFINFATAIAINLDNSRDCDITGNTITNNGMAGIYLDESNSNSLISNTITNNSNGIYNENSNHTFISGNT